MTGAALGPSRHGQIQADARQQKLRRQTEDTGDDETRRPAGHDAAALTDGVNNHYWLGLVDRGEGEHDRTECGWAMIVEWSAARPAWQGWRRLRRFWGTMMPLLEEARDASDYILEIESMAEQNPVIQVKDGIEFRGLGALVKRLLYPDTTGVKGATLSVVYINPGEEIVLHSHPEEELYYIISGQGTVTLDDEEVPVDAGTAVYIAGNRIHGQRPTGNEPMVMVAVVTPPFQPGAKPKLVEQPGNQANGQY